MDLRRILNPNSQEQQSSCFPNLSWNQRLLGFAACCVIGIFFCFIAGYFIQMMSFGSFLSAVAGSPFKFALLYSFGNIIALIGTGFLTGFVQQFKNMVDEERRLTSLIFFSSLIGCIVFSLIIEIKILVFVCVMIQIPSYIWYCATYIPFARDCIKSILGGCWQAIKNKFRR